MPKLPPIPRTLPARGLPLNAVSDALNISTVDRQQHRTTDKKKFYMHVSDVLATSGPRAFCPRQQVLVYHSDRLRVGGKLTPARKLLFATGNFMGDYIIHNFMAGSPYGGCVYAKWSCVDYPARGHDPAHSVVEDTADNVIGLRACKCGKPLTRHNEIDLVLPALMLTGHPDMILLVDGVFYIFEFKSFDRKDMRFDDLTMALADHRLQVSFYYKIMKAKGLNVSRRLSIVYVDRSNSKLFAGYPFKTFEVPPEADEFLDPFRNALAHVKHGIETKKLPPRICTSETCERARNCDKMAECFGRRGKYVTNTITFTVDRRGNRKILEAGTNSPRRG